jgi:branched chain amino acid efflux pump
MHDPMVRAELGAGARDILPLLVGVAPFGALFGIVSFTANMPFWATQLMSLFVFAGASQFAAVGLLAQGAAIPIIVLTTFIINLRHAFYGASVAGYLTGLHKAWRRVLAYTITDESYAIAIMHYRSVADGNNAFKHWYFLGANFALYLVWQVSTAIGFWAGDLIGNPLALGLDFTLPIVFIGILIPRLTSRADVATALVAGAIAVVAFSLPSKLGLPLAVAGGIAAGFGVDRWISRY